MVATRRTSTRLVPKTNSDSPGPSSRRRATSSKRTIALDSETESHSTVTKRHKGPSRGEASTQSGGVTSPKVDSTTNFATSFVKCSASDGETESSGYSKPSVDGSVDTPPTALSSRSSTAVAPPVSARGKKVNPATSQNITRRNTRSSTGQAGRDPQGGDPQGGADSHTDFEPEEGEPILKKGKGKEGPAQRNSQHDSSVEEQSDSGEDEEDEEDEDFYLPVPSSRKGKEVMKTRARRVSTIPPDTAIEHDDSDASDLSDVPSLFSDIFDSDFEGGFLAEEEEPDLEPGIAIQVAGPSSAPRAGRQPRARRVRRGATPRLTRAERARNELYNQHPELATIWDELEKTSKITVDKDPQPEGLSLTMLPFQLEGLHWMRCQEKTPFRGGILADEMGMGKTIQTLSLIMSQIGSKPNLVLAPTVALMQWKSEIEKYTGGSLKVLVYHGSNRETSVKELAKYDVILTTYSVIESVWRKQTSGFKRKAGIFKEDSALHSVRYHRVVLDEAHNIKDRACNTAKAVFALKTKFKLCLSGTPIQNRIGELFSLLRFLEADPFAYYFCRKCPCKSLHWKFSDMRQCDDCGHSPMSHLCFFNHDFLKPIISGNEREGQEAYRRLQLLLGQIMLRRTKLEKADDLGLPPKFIKVRRNYFSEAELDLYDSVYGDSKRKFDTYVAQGVILNNYANIFTLITRMRQLADHPDLVLRKHGEEGQTTPVCCLCDDEAEEAIKSRCHHIFCRLCVQEYIGGFAGENPECPKCHITLNIDLTQPAIEVDYSFVKKNSIINRIDMNNWRSSTKIEALVEELYNLRSDTHTIKSIVFSQFTSMLQLVEWRLKRAGFKTAMLEGSMSPAQREATINHFMEDVETTVFLVSLKAGGVALNLIEASQVYMLDPWWNPSVESQAMDRIHRIGQTRPCRVVKLIIENSIESRILELQEKKCKMIDATVGGDQKALERLTPGDMQFLFNN